MFTHRMRGGLSYSLVIPNGTAEKMAKLTLGFFISTNILGAKFSEIYRLHKTITDETLDARILFILKKALLRHVKPNVSHQCAVYVGLYFWRLIQDALNLRKCRLQEKWQEIFSIFRGVRKSQIWATVFSIANGQNDQLEVFIIPGPFAACPARQLHAEIQIWLKQTLNQQQTGTNNNKLTKSARDF